MSTELISINNTMQSSARKMHISPSKPSLVGNHNMKQSAKRDQGLNSLHSLRQQQQQQQYNKEDNKTKQEKEEASDKEEVTELDFSLFPVKFNSPPGGVEDEINSRLSSLSQTVAPPKRKSWHSNEKYNMQRREMIKKIVWILRAGNPVATEAWVKSLPPIAKFLEQRMYKRASSFEEYQDEKTLMDRIRYFSHRHYEITMAKKQQFHIEKSLLEKKKEDLFRRESYLQQEKMKLFEQEQLIKQQKQALLREQNNSDSESCDSNSKMEAYKQKMMMSRMHRRMYQKQQQMSHGIGALFMLADQCTMGPR